MCSCPTGRPRTATTTATPNASTKPHYGIRRLSKSHLADKPALERSTCRALGRVHPSSPSPHSFQWVPSAPRPIAYRPIRELRDAHPTRMNCANFFWVSISERLFFGGAKRFIPLGTQFIAEVPASSFALTLISRDRRLASPHQFARLLVNSLSVTAARIRPADQMLGSDAPTWSSEQGRASANGSGKGHCLSAILHTPVREIQLRSLIDRLGWRRIQEQALADVLLRLDGSGCEYVRIRAPRTWRDSQSVQLNTEQIPFFLVSRRPIDNLFGYLMSTLFVGIWQL